MRKQQYFNHPDLYPRYEPEDYTMKQFIIISLDRPNQPATEQAKQALIELFDAKPVLGCYKGQTETSFLVDYSYFDSMIQVAMKYGQESILVKDMHGIYLVLPESLEYRKLGTEFRMSNEIPHVDVWTLIDQTYFYL